MPTFVLPEDHLVFPHPLLSDGEEYPLAVGGKLTTDRLLLAYHFGIFPWFIPGEMVQWFFPNPRCVIYPESLKVSKSMRPYFNQQKYQWSINKNFDAVIRHCQTAGDRLLEGTWIGDEVLKAYTELHRLGYAHSVEVWDEKELVGGLYGIKLGKVFYGESMFSLKNNASKFGFISFVRHLVQNEGVKLIDCQIENTHLVSLGAVTISGETFLLHIRQWAWKASKSEIIRN